MKHEFALELGGNRYKGWDNVTIEKSMEQCCSTFSIDVIDSSVLDSIYPGIPCRLFIDDKVILTGYVDKRSRKANESGVVTIISGRDRTGDLVDCTAVKKGGGWKNTSLLTLCKDVCKPYGISVSVDSMVKSSVNEKFGYVKLDDCESTFSLIERLCRMRSVIPLSESNGNLLLTVSSSSCTTDALVGGKNIIDWNEDIDYSGRYSIYYVSSQSSGSGNSWNGKNVKSNGTATDSFIGSFLGRYRPLRISSESSSSSSYLKARASWEAVNRAAKSTGINVSVSGWFQSSGDLWERNLLVPVEYEKLNCSCTMLINSVSYKITEQDGFMCEMTLKDADSFTPEPSAVIAKNKKKNNPFAGIKF